MYPWCSEQSKNFIQKDIPSGDECLKSGHKTKKHAHNNNKKKAYFTQLSFSKL